MATDKIKKSLENLDNKYASVLGKISEKERQIQVLKDYGFENYEEGKKVLEEEYKKLEDLKSGWYQVYLIKKKLILSGHDYETE